MIWQKHPRLQNFCPDCCHCAQAMPKSICSCIKTKSLSISKADHIQICLWISGQQWPNLTPQTKRMNDCCNILPNVQHICTSSRRAVSMTSQINSKASEGFSEFTNDFDVNLGKKTTCGEHDKWRSCPQLVSNSLFTFLFLRTESRSHTRATKVVNSKLNSISALHPAQGDNTGRLHHHRPPVPRGWMATGSRSPDPKITACSSRVNATRWMTVVSALAQYCTRLILGRSQQAFAARWPFARDLVRISKLR